MTTVRLRPTNCYVCWVAYAIMESLGARALIYDRILWESHKRDIKHEIIQKGHMQIQEVLIEAAVTLSPDLLSLMTHTEPYYLLIMYTTCSVCFLQLTCYCTRVITYTYALNICPPNQTTKSMKEGGTKLLINIAKYKMHDLYLANDFWGWEWWASDNNERWWIMAKAQQQDLVATCEYPSSGTLFVFFDSKVSNPDLKQ